MLPEISGPSFIGRDNLFKGNIAGSLRLTIEYEDGHADVYESLTANQVGEEIGKRIFKELFAGRTIKVY